MVDLSSFRRQTLTFTNGAQFPYPMGAPVQPPADQIIQFRVGKNAVADPVVLPASSRPAPYAVDGTVAATRGLLLETTDDYGRPRMLLGAPGFGGLGWSDPVTETPAFDTTEILAPRSELRAQPCRMRRGAQALVGR